MIRNVVMPCSGTTTFLNWSYQSFKTLLTLNGTKEKICCSYQLYLHISFSPNWLLFNNPSCLLLFLVQSHFPALLNLFKFAFHDHVKFYIIASGYRFEIILLLLQRRMFFKSYGTITESMPKEHFVFADQFSPLWSCFIYWFSTICFW